MISTILVAPTPALLIAVQLNYIIDPPEFTSLINTFLSTIPRINVITWCLAEAFSFLKGPMDMYNLYKRSIMKKYRILPYNKWVEEDERNMMMVYLESKYLHLSIQNLKENNYGNNNKRNL